MNATTSALLEEFRGKMTGYAVQYSYFLNNLTVKTEAAALLPVEIELGSQKVHLEDASVAGILDDTRFFIYPNDKQLIPYIEMAVKKVHPEFDISHEKVEEAPDDNPDQIILKIPPVDQGRHDQLMDAVKNLGDACKTQMDACKGEYTARLGLVLAKAGNEDKKEAADAQQEIVDWHENVVKQYQENKEKEIDEAFTAWKNGNNEQQQEQSEQEQAQGDEAVFNMKMESLWL